MPQDSEVPAMRIEYLHSSPGIPWMAKVNLNIPYFPPETWHPTATWLPKRRKKKIVTSPFVLRARSHLLKLGNIVLYCVCASSLNLRRRQWRWAGKGVEESQHLPLKKMVRKAWSLQSKEGEGQEECHGDGEWRIRRHHGSHTTSRRLVFKQLKESIPLRAGSSFRGLLPREAVELDNIRKFGSGLASP